MLHQTRLGDVARNQLAPCPAVPSFVDVVDEADHAALARETERGMV